MQDQDYEQYFKNKIQQEIKWRKGNYKVKSQYVHKAAVRGVSFSPTVSHLLASCGIFFSFSTLFCTSLSIPSLLYILYCRGLIYLTGYDSKIHILDVNKYPKPEKSFGSKLGYQHNR